jgi:hypothetical protein
MCVYIRERRRRGRKIVGEMALLTKRWPKNMERKRKKKAKEEELFLLMGGGYRSRDV